MVNDTKVVDGGDVTFEGGTPLADTLEGAVAQAEGFTSGPAPGGVENMKFLAEQVKPVFSQLYDLNIAHVGPMILGGIAWQLVPFAYTLRKKQDQIAEIRLSDVHSSTLRMFLEAEYGGSIVRSGVYEATGLDKDVSIHFEKLKPYFPEIAELAKYGGFHTLILQNPYQFVLTLPCECRAFFTGVLKEKGMTTNTVGTDDFFNPLTFKDILKYAEKVNQVERVREYMDMMNRGNTP